MGERPVIRLTRDQLTYAFDRAIPPVVRIRSGETLTLETHDTSSGRIHRAEDLPEFIRVRDPLKVNPAAGPIYVDEAEPGDALAVSILTIKLAEYGFVRTLTGFGVLREGIEQQAIVMVRTEGDDLIFGGKLRFRARPMVGVLGTAPAEGTVYTAHPGPQGSNMDFNAAAVGTTVHLPVHVPGALLAIGDLHAAMGDGEVSGTGIEIAGEVTVRVEVVKGAAPARPWLETDDAWITTGQGGTLEAAVEQAVDGLVALLQSQFELSRTEAFLLVSARGDVRIGQCARIAGCDATVWAHFPKAVEPV
jgi:amidase